jgi:hypothetical protein
VSATPTIALAGILTTLGLSTGCSTTSGVTIDHGRTDPARCRTFDWLSSSEPGAAAADQYAKAAALDALRAKGYAVSAGAPDCRVAYALSTVAAYRPRPQLGIGLGGGSGGIGGGVALSLPLGHRSATAARFRLDVIDAGGNVPLWSGWVDSQFAGPQPSQAEATDLVRKILGKFPNRAP